MKERISMKGFVRQLIRHLARVAALVLITGLAAGVLVRYSPGALVDERELNQRLGEDSLAALRADRAKNASVVTYAFMYFKGLLRGDLGYSESNNAPIAQLIADRGPATLRELAIGLAGGWSIGLGVAISVGRFRSALIWDAGSSAIAGLVLSLPAALLAYLCLTAGAASGAVLVIVLAPRIFRFARNLLVQAYGSHHVETARARGVREWSILWSHVIPDARPQLLALLASSVSMGIGAAIPVEAICGSPGLGRLAWQAATARDLPLLMNLTMLIALVTILAMMFSEKLTAAPRDL